MAQKVVGYVKLQIPAGKATPAPPVGPALGQHGVNIAAFTKEFNERTKNDMGLIIPVVITVYADRSFTFITKTPPAAVLIKKECNIESGSGVPNKTKVATISKASIQKIAELKMRDLNAASLEAAMSMIAGTARSMGVVVGEYGWCKLCVEVRRKKTLEIRSTVGPCTIPRRVWSWYARPLPPSLTRPSSCT